MLDVQDYIELGLTHSVHTSERKSFRGCRRRWDWVSREYYYPQITVRPLEFGTAYHTAMEHYYHPDTWGMDKTIVANGAIMAFKHKVKQQLESYRKIHGNEGVIDPEVEADYKDRVELGLGMLRYHLFKIAPDLDEGLTPKYVEVKFEVPIMSEDGKGLWCTCTTCFKRWFNSDHGKKVIKECEEVKGRPCDAEDHFTGLPVTYGGRIDCIIEGPDGRLWLFDWKTAARLSKGNEEFLLLEDQIVSYVWALKHVLKIDIVGFIWHEQKKAYPIEPEPMKVRRKGCIYSVSKAQDTSYEVYKKTVEEGDPDGFLAGAYNEFLDWLEEQEALTDTGYQHADHFQSGNSFYQRYQVVKSDEELRSAGHMIYLEAAEMTDSNLRIYPNPGRFHCGGCAFKEPCKGQNNGEDYIYALNTLFERRTRHYWEDAQPTTDRPQMGGIG